MNFLSIIVNKSIILYPTANYEELCSFSFINKQDNKKLQMHQLMKESLQKTQEMNNPNSIIRNHQAIKEYYSRKLENIDVKEITQEHEIALKEAFYHAKESLKAEDLFNWFITASDPFFKAAYWQLITPMDSRMLQIIEIDIGIENPSVAATLNNLAGLYNNMGEYEKAFPLCQRALEIKEKVLGPQHPDIATILNNLAELHRHMGEYEKALPLYLKGT